MRIVFAKGLTQKEKKAVLQSYEDEEKAEIEAAHKHPMWEEVKSFINSQRANILVQVKRQISGSANPNLVSKEVFGG